MVVVEKVIIVSVHVRYFSFFSFFSLCQTGYVSLRRRDGTWSLTIDFTNVTLVSDDINWKYLVRNNVHSLPVTSYLGF